MPVSKRWHFTLSTTESSKSVNLSLPKQIGPLFIAVTAILVILFTTSLIYISANHHKIITAQNIISENELLKEKLFTISTEMDSIRKKLDLMEEWEDKIRSDKNFKSVNKEIREMGVGGIPQTDSTFSYLGSDFHQKYNSVLCDLSSLSRKTDFDYISHKEVAENTELRELLYRNTPSIYPTYGRISDRYGWRKHPITKKRSFHEGLDFANVTGTPVYATADGVVKKTTRSKNMGKYIVLKHQFGYQTNYGHLHKINVKQGDEVKRGQIIGVVGNTGRSTGAHLHYEVLRYNKNRNPYKYLNKQEKDIVLSKK